MTRNRQTKETLSRPIFGKYAGRSGWKHFVFSLFSEPVPEWQHSNPLFIHRIGLAIARRVTSNCCSLHWTTAAMQIDAGSFTGTLETHCVYSCIFCVILRHAGLYFLCQLIAWGHWQRKDSGLGCSEYVCAQFSRWFLDEIEFILYWTRSSAICITECPVISQTEQFAFCHLIQLLWRYVFQLNLQHIPIYQQVDSK